MEKVSEESQHLDMNLTTMPWVFSIKVPYLNAKNSWHGFSPFQLVFGWNPKLPSTCTDKPPALIQHDTGKILPNNLTVLHKTMQAFILSASSEKIWRALKNNVLTSGDTKYITRDNVCFKKINEKRWRGRKKGIRSRWVIHFSKIWKQLWKRPSIPTVIG